MEFRLRPLGFTEFLQNNRQLRKWNESKIEKIRKNTVKNRCGFVTDTLTTTRRKSYKTTTVFDCIFSYFSIFDSFHLFNFLMIFFGKNLHETQGSQSKFHELNIYIYLIYIYIYIYSPTSVGFSSLANEVIVLPLAYMLGSSYESSR